MKLTLNRADLRDEHLCINCSLTKVEHFTDKAQAAIAIVGRATFYEYDRRNYNAIHPPRPESGAGLRMFPMTDGPDLPWSLAEEIYGSDAFDYFEQSRYLRGGNGLEEMAESGGWSWRALADCFDTYSAQCDYEAESDTRLEQRAEAFHAGDS